MARPLPLVLVLGALAGFTLLTSCAGTEVLISNTVPRLDSTGQILRVHDGNIVQWEANGLYYWYGMSYGLCMEPRGGGCSHQGGDPNCGFLNTHNVSIFTSPNLASGSWQYAGEALPVNGGRPEAIYYRPKVVFNPNTQLYVLWINGVPAGDFGASFYLAATSPNKTGPFTVATTNITLAHPSPGDFDLFVDDDGKGYIIYTSVNQGHNMSVELLSSDFLSSANANSGFFGATFVEAPALFKRDGVYYALFGHCCCFCAEGSDIGVYTAASPLGPYTPQGDIGCKSSTSAAWWQVQDCVSSTQAQQNCVFEVTTTTGKILLWTGDRWQSSPDGHKDHDFQFWAPLVWNTSGPVPVPQPIPFLDNFTLEMP